MNDEYILKRVSNGEIFPIPIGSILVGRSDSCDVPVLVGQASREHARLRLQNEGVLVEDLHSTNGTFINDKRIESATLLKPGDVVRFDQEIFSLHRKELANETIYARPIDAKSPAAMSIEEQDEEDVNATAYRQVFVMPPNWEDFTSEQTNSKNIDGKKQNALNNFINKSFQSLSGKHLIALIISKGDEPPIIKTVATDVNQRWSIGRANDSDLVVDQPDISNIHSYLEYKDGTWTLVDNHSSNGIWKNKKRLNSISLQDKMHLNLASLDVEVWVDVRD